MKIANFDEIVLKLKNDGFVIASESHSTEAFGNRLVVLKSPVFQVKITSDRGDVFFDIGPAHGSDAWCDLRHIRQMLTEQGQWIDAGPDVGFAELVRTNKEAIARLFHKNRLPETVARAKNLENSERSDFLGSIGLNHHGGRQ